MELFNKLYKSKIEKIPLIRLKSLIDSSTILYNTLKIKNENELIILKCVREYYLDPSTLKKIKKTNITNECSSIQKKLGITNCNTFHCKKCHKTMIDKFFDEKSFLIKKNNM